MTAEQDIPLLSIVVPFYNEEKGLDVFFARIERVLSKVTSDYEIVCVDDGSRDRTLAGLIAHRVENPRIKVMSLSRNFGKDIALSAGLDYSTGRAVIPMDADLQDPPELIAQMVEKWQEGHDVVYAKRASRQTDGAFKRISARLFYRFHNMIADVPIPEDTGDFRLMDRRVVDALRGLPEKNRFMKGLFTWVGFRQTGIEYDRAERAAGQTKWNYHKLWRFAVDGITASSTLPLRIWTYLGFAISAGGFGFAIYLLVRTLLYGADVPGYASLMIAILVLGGINIIATGILGEYVSRIFVEVRQRPLYLVRESHGMENDPSLPCRDGDDKLHDIRPARRRQAG